MTPPDQSRRGLPTNATEGELVNCGRAGPKTCPEGADRPKPFVTGRPTLHTKRMATEREVRE